MYMYEATPGRRRTNRPPSFNRSRRFAASSFCLSSGDMNPNFDMRADRMPPPPPAAAAAGVFALACQKRCEIADISVSSLLFNGWQQGSVAFQKEGELSPQAAGQTRLHWRGHSICRGPAMRSKTTLPFACKRRQPSIRARWGGKQGSRERCAHVRTQQDTWAHPRLYPSLCSSIAMTFFAKQLKISTV